MKIDTNNNSGFTLNVYQCEVCKKRITDGYTCDQCGDLFCCKDCMEIEGKDYYCWLCSKEMDKSITKRVTDDE